MGQAPAPVPACACSTARSTRARVLATATRRTGVWALRSHALGRRDRRMARMPGRPIALAIRTYLSPSPSASAAAKRGASAHLSPHARRRSARPSASEPGRTFRIAECSENTGRVISPATASKRSSSRATRARSQSGSPRTWHERGVATPAPQSRCTNTLTVAQSRHAATFASKNSKRARSRSASARVAHSRNTSANAFFARCRWLISSRRCASLPASW